MGVEESQVDKKNPHFVSRGNGLTLKLSQLQQRTNRNVTSALKVTTMQYFNKKEHMVRLWEAFNQILLEYAFLKVRQQLQD